MDNGTTLSDPQAIQQEVITDPTAMLEPTLTDAELVSIIDEKVAQSRAHFSKELNLDARRQEMRDFWKGNQLDVKKMDTRYQVPYIDNIVWQNLETKIGLAAGRMPDLIVTPPNDDDQSKQNAQDIEDALKHRITSNVMKRLVKDGLRNYHLDLTAAIKIRWDEDRGEDGDFVFELVRANRIGYDHTATIPHDGYTAENCALIYEWIEEPLAKVLAKFPQKRDQLLAQVGGSANLNAKRLASKIRYMEAWYTFYTAGGKVEEGVCAKFHHLVLGKDKNPYWDWTGSTKIEADENGEYSSSKTYNNFFDRPRKPYMFMTYQNLGETIVDDTTAVEQGVPMQKINNKRGAQITELADRVSPRYIFSADVMSKEEAARVDPKDPTESIWLDQAGPESDVRKAVMMSQATAPPAILFNDQASIRNRLDSMFATHGTTRGESSGGQKESGISKQLSREGDLTIADDMSDIIVERITYEMSNWALQMMKLKYTKPHFVRYTGKDGERIYREITQDAIEDGLICDVKSSTIDKNTRRALALDLVAAKAIDPLTLFEDLDVDNPKERTRRLIAFQIGEADGYASYMKETGIEEEGAAAPEGEDLLTAEQGQADLQALLAGQPVEPAGMPGEQYVTIFAEYIESPDFDSLDPESAQLVLDYVRKLKEIVNSNAGAGNEVQQADPAGTPDAQGAPGQPQAQVPPAFPMAG